MYVYICMCIYVCMYVYMYVCRRSLEFIDDHFSFLISFLPHFDSAPSAAIYLSIYLFNYLWPF